VDLSIDARFEAAARGWIGVPSMHQGRSRAGVDCIGLVVMAARDCGLDAPVAANYGRFQAYFQYKPMLMGFCERVGNPGQGIIALFMNSAVLHVGIITAIGTVIHAPGVPNPVKEHMPNFAFRQFWRPRWPNG
jgi:cell wall-associated NlpC family hydrolase